MDYFWKFLLQYVYLLSSFLNLKHENATFFPSAQQTQMTKRLGNRAVVDDRARAWTEPGSVRKISNKILH